jgi:hypothetical protein
MFSQLYLSHQKTKKKNIRNIEIFSQDLLIITKLTGTNKSFFLKKHNEMTIILFEAKKIKLATMGQFCIFTMIFHYY